MQVASVLVGDIIMEGEQNESLLQMGSKPDTTTIHCPCTTDLIQAYEAWALQNYGDSGKTKTVTRRKYDRIKQILNGDEAATSDNSKFRFWVRAKGFKLGPPPAGDTSTEEQVVYIPIKTQVSDAQPMPSNNPRSYSLYDFYSITQTC